MGDRVMHNNSQGKNQEVEDQRRNVKFYKNKTPVTACNDSLNAMTLNVNSVCATCDTCVLNDKHDMCVLNSVAKSLKKTVSSKSNQKPRNITRKQYERISKTCSWWYPKFTPSGYKWKPKCGKENVNSNTSMPLGSLIEIVLFIVDSGCSKHMTRNLKLLINFVEKFLRTVKYGNDQIAPILGYGDLVQGLNHNLLSVGQFCDADLEVTFQKSTCFIRDLKGNDLLTCSRGTDLYSITLQDTNCPNPICLMAKASSSQAWLWHRRLSHLNFDTINLLSKNDIVNLHAYFATKGILHQTSVARTPEKNDVVERQNRTLVEAARTMLSVAKVPLFFSVEAIVTACFTQNCSLIIPRHEKNPYHIINNCKPPVKFFHIFGSLCYIVRDGENLDKMKEKGYSTQPRAYRVFNKRTRVIMESIHMNFDELPQMTSDHVVSKSSTVSSADAPTQCQQHITPLKNHTTPAPTCQVPTLAPTVTSSENINQAEHDQVVDDEFINIFCTPIQDRGETSSRHVDSTRRQLESDGKMYMFALTVNRTEPKNIKEGMADSAWIESMQEELHQFD
nr:hypothetical protein [Tanacetum cinerariifolium]